jgi:hypothetical protein
LHPDLLCNIKVRAGGVTVYRGAHTFKLSDQPSEY